MKIAAILTGSDGRLPENQTPIVYVGMCADYLHHGHINILEEAYKYGEVWVGLLTDEAMEQYKRKPSICFEDRLRLVSAIKYVSLVVPQDTLDYRPNLEDLKPEFVVHGKDWRDGPQRQAREDVIQALAQWGGVLIEPEYTPGISSTEIIGGK